MTLIPYESREQAGELLANFILDKNKALFKQIEEHPENFLVFTIPNGGVPVAEGFCHIFNLKYEILIVRKIKIPYNPEAGFGSITTDGTILFNESLLSQLSLSKEQIEQSILKTKAEIQERITFYEKKNISGQENITRIQGKNIFIMDDGLASGFTMQAGIKMIKKYKPKTVYICVPTAPYHTVIRIQDEKDEIFCPNIRKTTWFAVADAYKHWYDLSEAETVNILAKSKYYIENVL